MVRVHTAAFAGAASVLLLAACSGGAGNSRPPAVTPTPTSTQTSTPTPTPTTIASATPTPVVTPTATPVVTPTPTPVATLAPAIAGSLTSFVVCAQQEATCPNDLDADATSGEEAVVYVKNVSGTLTATNRGGAALATITTAVYKTIGNTSEDEVIYKSATSSPATDVLTIADSGSKSSLTIDVRIVAPGADGGADYFTLSKTTGTVCPGDQVTEQVGTQDGPTVTMSTDNITVVSSGRSGNGPFAIDLRQAGSALITATSGNADIIFPVNIPAAGFTPSC